MLHALSRVTAWPTVTVQPAKSRFRHKAVPSTLSNVLVVEHRDEVFARIEADLKAWGIEVHRAADAEEARRTYHRWPLDLVLTYSDLPDETGWLLACKLRLAQPLVWLWIYTPQCALRESVLAEFIGVEEVVPYSGDLQRLAGELFERLVVAFHSMDRRTSNSQ